MKPSPHFAEPSQPLERVPALPFLIRDPSSQHSTMDIVSTLAPAGLSLGLKCSSGGLEVGLHALCEKTVGPLCYATWGPRPTSERSRGRRNCTVVRLWTMESTYRGEITVICSGRRVEAGGWRAGWRAAGWPKIRSSNCVYFLQQQCIRSNRYSTDYIPRLRYSVVWTAPVWLFTLPWPWLIRFKFNRRSYAVGSCSPMYSAVDYNRTPTNMYTGLPRCGRRCSAMPAKCQ